VLDVCIKRERRGKTQGAHDGEAQGVREAEPAVIEPLVERERRQLQLVVGANEGHYATFEQPAREAASVAGADPASQQRDGLVQDVMRRERRMATPQQPALHHACLRVVLVTGVLERVERRRVDEDLQEDFERFRLASLILP
jgi:hypothetical protein